jgi:hypothetical protein
MAAMGANKTRGPAQMFEIGRARRVIGENPLKLRQGSGKASHLHALKIDQAVGFGNKPDKHGLKIMAGFLVIHA